MDREIYDIVAFNREHLKGIHLPAYGCPSCSKGVLLSKDDDDHYRDELSVETKPYLDRDFVPEGLEYRISLVLRCNRCREVVYLLARGLVELWRDDEDEDKTRWEQMVYPLLFEPSLKIINVPRRAPSVIHESVAEACSLFFTSPAAAANGLRRVLELLLDGFDVPRKTADGGFRPLAKRINEYVAKNPGPIAEYLTASKEAGNMGSHDAQFPALRGIVLDAFELVEHILQESFPDDPGAEVARLGALAARIVAASRQPHQK